MAVIVANICGIINADGYKNEEPARKFDFARRPEVRELHFTSSTVLVELKH